MPKTKKFYILNMYNLLKINYSSSCLCEFRINIVCLYLIIFAKVKICSYHFLNKFNALKKVYVETHPKYSGIISIFRKQRNEYKNKKEFKPKLCFQADHSL